MNTIESQSTHPTASAAVDPSRPLAGVSWNFLLNAVVTPASTRDTDPALALAEQSAQQSLPLDALCMLEVLRRDLEQINQATGRPFGADHNVTTADALEWLLAFLSLHHGHTFSALVSSAEALLKGEQSASTGSVDGQAIKLGWPCHAMTSFHSRSPNNV